MLTALPARRGTPTDLPSITRPRAALAAPSVAARDGWLAGVDGNPRWLDPALSSLAADAGHATALLAAYREQGDRAPALMAGAFACALIAPDSAQALLITDRMGVRPLAFGGDSSSLLAFASSSESVAAHPLVGRRIDPQALFDYAYFHMVPSPGAIFRAVQKLELAQMLIQNGPSRSRRGYWTPSFRDSSARRDELANELHERLVTAVERCTLDERTGSFLSGGLDSSTVSGVLARHQGGHVATFSIGFDEPGYDELEYARAAARHFRTDAREYYVTADDIVEALPQIAAAYDEPFGNASAVPTLFCARIAQAAGISTLLAGDGGDELFAGNERYAKQKMFERYYRLPSVVRAVLVEPLMLGSPIGNSTAVLRKARSYIEQALVPMPLRLQTYNFLERQDPSGIFTAEFLSNVDIEQPPDLFRRCYESAPTDDLVDRMLFLDWKFTLADNDLRKVNRMCELGGVRVSYPMLDDDLVEFSTRVPPWLKLRGLQLRDFYRRAMSEFLPREVVEKRKHGFGLPFGQWLKRSPALQALVRGSLEALKQRGVVRRDFIDTLIAEHRGGNANFYGTFIWVLVMLEQWFEQHERSYVFGD